MALSLERRGRPRRAPGGTSNGGRSRSSAWRRIWPRAIRLVVVVFLVTFATSIMLDLVPGDPAATIAGDGATPEAIAAVRVQYGLDDPLIVRYFHWLGGLLHGDLGVSYITRKPVLDTILARTPVTLELALSAIVFALVLSIPFALWAAYRKDRLVDRVLSVVTSALIALPGFLAGVGLVFVFSVQFKLLPVTGWASFWDDPVDNVRHAILPVLALSLPAIAVFIRVLRADVIATLQQDFIASARAKGLNPWSIMFRHAFRPSAFSLLTVAGIRLAELIGGTVVIEMVFAIPGVGSLLVTSILGKDLIVVQAVVGLIAIFYLIVNIVIDIAYRYLDPRVGD